MSGITTHVLDVSIGKPAVGIELRLERKKGHGEWETIGVQRTDSDGRAKELYSEDELTIGSYRLSFDVGSYFGDKNIESFYDAIVIEFQLRVPSQHYHVPLLLSPFGYSTYRGS